jgi:ATP-dependent Clp protease adaptor protein ClpS
VSRIELFAPRDFFMHRIQRVELNQSPIRAAAIRAASIEAPEKTVQKVWKPYPNFKVIVLNDDFNTFEHVANCLLKYIPNMLPEKAWGLTTQVHEDGQAIVWIGPQEQAELYHTQLAWEGLTMAPLEAA